jgi:hypothetical protein
MTAEEAFAEYRKRVPTFDVKPAFVDGWRMGREATILEVIEVIEGRPGYSDNWVSIDRPYIDRESVIEAVRALLESDDG